MQILLKLEQVERKYFIYRWKSWNMADNIKPSVDIELLESDLYIVDWILWVNQDSKSLNKV